MSAEGWKGRGIVGPLPEDGGIRGERGVVAGDVKVGVLQPDGSPEMCEKRDQALSYIVSTP